MSAELIKLARQRLQEELSKSAFVPMDAAGASAPPPADPMAGGMPPPDPAAMGGMPPDPAAGGAPPGDPGAQPVMLTLNDLMQFMQLMGSGGGAPAGAPLGDPAAAAGGMPAPAPAPAPAGAPAASAGADGKGKGGGKKALEEKVDAILSLLQQMVAIQTGQVQPPAMASALGNPVPLSGDPAAAAAAGAGAMGAPSDMGAPADPALAAGVPAGPGGLAGAAPAAEGGGMTVSASHKKQGAAALARIIQNLNRG